MIALAVATASGAAGCKLRQHEFHFGDSADHFQAVATEIEYPDIETHVPPGAIPPPVLLSEQGTVDYWDLSLQDAIQLTLKNSDVLRDLGGAVILAPGAVETVHGPALQETDPQSGIEAALSAFDANLAATSFFEKNDRALNNELLGGGTRLLQQDLLVFQSELSKRTATGSEFAIRKNLDYDHNNAPGNLFPSAWNTNLEVEMRQPWLQGRGIDFNRIAGTGLNQPGVRGRGIPGIYNGVLIARLNTDVRLADFEIGVRDLVSNVENAYWDLYFAYRDLDARIAARDASLETWRRVRALFEAGRRGGEAEKEAQARENYYRFQEEVENALSGRLFDGTRTNNGSRGGTFRGLSGVHVSQRRLRLLMGVPVTDGKLIRPIDQPVATKVLFDWNEIAVEALARRAELRRQKWLVQRRELELIASRNYLLPQLDSVGRYRWRGFGRELLDPTRQADRFDNAFANLTGGDFQEWMLGLELSVPLGFRQGHSAVRNAQLMLAREKAILQEQEHQIVHDLSASLADMDRAYTVAQTNFNRRLAAREQLAAVQAAYEADTAPLDQVVLAQRVVAESESAYHRALTEYMLAIRNVHFEKGSLLDHCEVYLAEGGWPERAYMDAKRREMQKGRPYPLNYTFRNPRIVSQGAYVQQAVPGEHHEAAASDAPQWEEVPAFPDEADEGEEIPATGTLRLPPSMKLLRREAASGEEPAEPLLTAPAPSNEAFLNPLRDEHVDQQEAANRSGPLLPDPASPSPRTAGSLDDVLSDFGGDAVPQPERLSDTARELSVPLYAPSEAAFDHVPQRPSPHKQPTLRR